MSMLIMAAVLCRGLRGSFTYCPDPHNPFSSPVKARNRTDLDGFCPDSMISWAAAISAAVPEALSSAPLCTARSSGARDPSPPKPRWS